MVIRRKKITPKNIKIERDAELVNVLKYGKSAIGKTDYEDFLNGKYVAGIKRIHAMCYWCMGYYADGKINCGCVLCPNYTYMPYLNKNGKKDDE